MQQPTPHTETIVKTLIVKKRGKRYFDCLLGGHKAKLVINEVSDGLALDTVAKMQLKDLSKTTRFGTTLTFEAVAIESERDGKKMYLAAKKKNEAIRWLKYAEDDVREGSYTTNAMSKAIFFCQPYPELCERVKAMEAKGWANAQAANERKTARKLEREAASAAACQALDERRRNRCLFPLNALPPFDTPIEVGKAVRVYTDMGESFRISDDHPSVWGSYLRGHEGERGAYCYYRNATNDEIVELTLAEQREDERKAERMAVKVRVGGLIERIKHEGEHPDGWHQPEGERLFDTQNVNGGGHWFVLSGDDIWFVMNNGRDGDNWSRNNVTTGGAGAIGWRIPYDEAVACELRELAQQTAALA